MSTFFKVSIEKISNGYKTFHIKCMFKNIESQESHPQPHYYKSILCIQLSLSRELLEDVEENQ